MTTEQNSNYPTVDESVIADASFDLVQNEPIEAVFEINPFIADLNYVHSQDTASATWTIHHRLGKFPSVTIVDSAGTTVGADVTYIDANTLQIDFIGAFSGKAYLN